MEFLNDKAGIRYSIVWCSTLFLFAMFAGCTGPQSPVYDVKGNDNQAHSHSLRIHAGSGEKKALLIAVEQFDKQAHSRLPSHPELSKDLELMQDALSGAGFTKVPIMSTVSGEKPTAAAIKLKVGELGKDMGFNDTLLVYFTGHSEGGYLCGWDYDTGLAPAHSGLGLKEFTSLIKSTPAGQKILILDACHSGRAINAASDVKGDETTGLDMDILKASQARGFYILASSQPNERSWIHPKEGVSHFTKYLAEGLTGKADGSAWSFHDCLVDLSELHQYVSRLADEEVRQFHIDPLTGQPARQRAALLMEGDAMVALKRLENCVTDEQKDELEKAELKKEVERLKRQMRVTPESQAKIRALEAENRRLKSELMAQGDQPENQTGDSPESARQVPRASKPEPVRIYSNLTTATGYPRSPPAPGSRVNDQGFWERDVRIGEYLSSKS